MADVPQYRQPSRNQAILLAPADFGQDGDFDIDGNNNLDFTGDVMFEAQFGLIGTPGTPTGICH